MKKLFKNFENNTGFTMIELIISIFILSIAVVGIFSAFSIAVILTSDAADRLTATYLAQEGMEIIRNIRDTNWLASGATWTDGGLMDCDAGTGGCEADYTTTGFGSKLVEQLNGDHLYTDDACGFYSYNTAGTRTKFERKIIITPLTDVDNESGHIIKVSVQVSWDEKATILSAYTPAGSTDPSDPSNPYKCNPANCIATEGTLYNWY